MTRVHEAVLIEVIDFFLEVAAGSEGSTVIPQDPDEVELL